VEYSKKLTAGLPVVVEVIMQLWLHIDLGEIKRSPCYRWTFAPDRKRPTGSRIYQTTLKSLKLLLLANGGESVSTKTTAQISKGKGKRKADGQAGQGSPSKKGQKSGGETVG
jgi:hypothetical protein